MTRIGYGEEAALREQLRESEMRAITLKKELAEAKETLLGDRLRLAMHFGRELAEAYGELPRLVGIPECISIGGGGAPE